jgi:hypothetical protein
VVQDFVGQGSGCVPTVVVAPIPRKYLSVVFNPILENRSGERLITNRGYNDPATLAAGYVADMRTASHGIAQYSSVGTIEIDGYPVKEDGFQYDDTSFLACLDDINHTTCHKPDQINGFGYAVNYSVLLNQLNLCTRFNAGEFDEVWFFGAPFMGFWEAVQTGSTAIGTNGPIVGPSTCNGRLNLMGFSYERGVSEMLEDFAHRSEGTLSTLLPDGGALFSDFRRFDLTSPGQAQCGNVHWAPNSTFEYDWSNPRVVMSSCDDWLNFPNRTGATKATDCSAWGCDPRQHKIWWLSHFPAFAGVSPGGVPNNWWPYLLSR